MKKLRLIPLLAVLLAGCGGHTKSAISVSRHAVAPACPEAANGHGSPGICAPRTFSIPRTVERGPTYPDRSNNDPCYCGAQIKAAGQVGLIAKANQGVGFIDSTEVGMIASARAAGLAVGVYDFDQDYTVAEARVLVARAQAAGIFPTTPNTFPLYFDVEYGAFSYSGLMAQIAYVRALGYRVGIYTGQWYWGPHAGCRWPTGVTAWLSGYPVATPICGLPSSLFVAHQFTDIPVDETVYLGSSFAAFVNALPPKPRVSYAIFPPQTHKLDGRLISERQSVKAWDAHACSNPVRRPICRQLRSDLLLLRGRLWYLAHHQGQLGEFNLPADWSRFHWGRRFHLIEARLLERS